MAARLAQSILVFEADAFRVVEGANLDDAASVLDDITLDDMYEVIPAAQPQRLSLFATDSGPFEIAPDSEIGTPGAPLFLDAAWHLMSSDGHSTEVLFLVEVDDEGHIANSYVLPLAQLQPRRRYRLVGADRKTARKTFAQVACVSFARGTHITMSTGAQVCVENLSVGDRLLTRDGGPQVVRWIGQNTVRASGDFAPIVITAGTLNNENDLIVSPDHRLFVYQRTDRLGAGQSELLVKARHLVNGDTIFVQDGGYVDYFQILFDQHHIIYAEGIAAESTLIDPRTRPALPPDLIEKMKEILPRHDDRTLHGLDVQKALLDRPDAIDLLRRASLR